MNCGEYTIHVKNGAILFILKAFEFDDHLVVGQIATGWVAKKYGIPNDLISQVDLVAL